MDSEKGYGALEWMSSEKIDKLLNIILMDEIGEIGGRASMDAIT